TNQVGWGPFVLAWTPHAVLAAPYHRLSASILPAHRVFAGPPDEAHAILTGMRVTYVITCASAAPALRGPGTEAPDPASLAARLRAGDVPGWLEPVRATQGKAIVVYRVTR
ncbi:MAG TPA: GtrA family protein, partial [Xanthobacteraceae bacterium]|nr:GtrA family protein [Xanthobacteraceae bacterium]